MTSTGYSVLGGIGNTPLVELQKVVPPGSARIVAMLEGANPAGRMKDRMAKAAIGRAEASGRLQPGGAVAEYTAGTTDIARVLACAAKEYALDSTTSKASAWDSCCRGGCRNLSIRLRP